MIVVTGATGNVGRALVGILAEDAATGARTTAVSRNAADTPAGVRHVRADLARAETLRPALDGTEALFLLTPASLMAEGDVHEILDLAKTSGVGRVVLLSSQGVATGRHPGHLEAAVEASGLEWTMLRPGNFMSNTYGWAGSVRAQRLVEAPFGDVALPAVDPYDIAAVAAVTLREPGHTGKRYTLTGPEPVSPRGQAAAIGAALGEPVTFAELTREQARERMLTFMPAPVADATLGILGTPSPEEQAVSADVERLLGRPARTFREWAEANAAAFR